jgi:transcriptional regulator with XRE-family HTH domain
MTINSNQLPARHCQCGARLARDNSDTLCAPCRKKARDETLGAPQVPAEFWEDDLMQKALASWHMGRVCVAYRHHPFHGPRPLSQELVAGWLGMAQAQLSRIENGPPINDLNKLIHWAHTLKIPARHLWFDLPESRRNDTQATTASDNATGLPHPREALPGKVTPPTTDDLAIVRDMTDDELEALELARRVEASDVSRSTLERLTLAVNNLCCRYASTPPTILLPSVRRYRRYITHLLDARATLDQKRQLLVTGGWLSLIAAVIYEDLGQRRAAAASRQTARQLGSHAEHHELMAWSFEIQAWQALLDGQYVDAIQSCQVGQELVRSDSSAAAQLTAQEARAWGRLKRKPETYATLKRAQTVVARLPMPQQPDHHFIFDPRKLTSYTATTLTWLRDAKPAEEYCREVIHDYDEEHKPRRLATARIDLAIVVTQQDRPEEACHLGHLALASGRLVPSNIWRATELDHALVRRYGDLPDVREFHEHYVEVRKTI